MKPYDRNYIECRFFLIGDREVGKKSFIERLLSIPSTSLIRNVKAEEEFKSKILRLLKENELSDEEYYNNLNNFTVNSSSKENSKLLKKIDETKKFSKTGDIKIKSRNNYNPDSLEEKKNKLVMKSLMRYQVLSSRFTRPPIPEYPSKLFNVNKTKIVIKPYYIFPGEEMPEFYLNEEDNSNTDYAIDSNPKINMKGVINDLYNLKNDRTTIVNIDKLVGYKIFVYNFFIFLYDLGSFESFEMMQKYYMKINNKLNITDIGQNCITCIIGNKKDRKINLDKEQEIRFNEFIKSYNLYSMEIATKPFFNFDKFFYDLFFTVLNKYHETLFSEENFKSNFESVSLKHATFSKSLRETYDPYENNPGPIYNLNSLYRYISPKELIESFHNKKKRFNQKIFSNKLGPVFGQITEVRDLMGKKKLQYFAGSQIKGGVINKTPKGYSLGIAKGKLNLLKSRKEIISEINKNIRESVEGDCTLYNVSPSSKSKEKDYFDGVKKRKKNFLNELNTKNKEINEKHLEMCKNNLKLIEQKEEEKKNLLLTKLKLFKSSSMPNMLVLANKSKTEQDFHNDRLMNILYPKNHEYMTKYKKKRKYIIENMPKTPTPGPNAYNVSTNMLDPRKGASILERRKPIEYPRADPLLPNFKDEFDQIVERGLKTAGIQKFFRPRFRDTIKEKDIGSYKDDKIWKKWENNRKNVLNQGRIKKFLDYRKHKFDIQKENQEKINEEKKQIEEITRALLIKKGYGDPSEVKNINYSQVEESSPKYSIKGRNYPRTKSYEDLGSFFLNESEEVLNAIINEQMNRPLPDLNFVRPKLPGFIFSKADRFAKTRDYGENVILFKDGIFGQKTQEYFFLKEPLSNKANRTVFGDPKNISPSPAQYRIKGSFEILAEKGKKISDRRDYIKNKNNTLNTNNKEIIEKNKNNKENKISKENNKNFDSKESSHTLTLNLNA